MNSTLPVTTFKLAAALILIFGSPMILADDQADMKQKLLACAGCHEQQSTVQNNYVPSIAGKPTEYLYQQLLNYREGRRINNTMQNMLAYLSADYLHEIASFYAQLPARDFDGNISPVDSTVTLSAAQASLGKTLVQDGASGPACIACHGNDLRGDGVAIPSLRGLSATYISSQLGAWQANTRQARAPDCMKEVANHLNGNALSAVAQYIAYAFEEPATVQPIDAELPLPCGALK